MSSVALGELVEIRGGGTPDKKIPDYWDGSIPWASVKDFKSTSLASTIDKITQAGVANSATQVIPAGNIIVPTRMAVGKAAINEIDLAINQDLKALIPSQRIDRQYLLHALLANAKTLEDQATGATVKGIKLDALRSLRIPLPPLEEQRRIAGILDQADALRRLRTRALDKLNTLGLAIFHEMFGDLISNEFGFDPATVGDVIEGFETGKNLAEDPDANRKDGYRVLKISAVTSGTFRPEESKALPSSYQPPESHVVHDGDLLFSRANTAQLIGATAFVRTDKTNLVLPDKLWRFVWKPESPVRPEFVKALFSSPAFRYEIGKRSSGTSGSMKNIGKQKVMGIAFGLPDIRLQEEFGRKLSAANDQFEVNERLLASSEKLFSSLQHRAFRGEL